MSKKRKTKRPGRPKGPVVLTKVGFVLPEEVMAQLRALAERTEQSQSSHVKRALLRYFESFDD